MSKQPDYESYYDQLDQITQLSQRLKSALLDLRETRELLGGEDVVHDWTDYAHISHALSSIISHHGDQS